MTSKNRSDIGWLIKLHVVVWINVSPLSWNSPQLDAVLHHLKTNKHCCISTLFIDLFCVINKCVSNTRGILNLKTLLL